MNQNVTAALGERIKALRQAASLTQAHLSEALGNEPETVSRWERGEYAPSIEMLEQIAEVLGFSVEDFFSYAGNPSEPSLNDLRHSLSDIAYETHDFETLKEIVKSAKKIVSRRKKMQT